jgi:hypothetical protein
MFINLKGKAEINLQEATSLDSGSHKKKRRVGTAIAKFEVL